MARPEALIRQVLLLQLMEDTIHKALVEAKKDLAAANVKIVTVDDTVHSINVEYIADNHHNEGFFMRKMLEAEARGYMRRLPDVKKRLGK